MCYKNAGVSVPDLWKLLSDNKDGALFILSLYKLTEHEISLAVDSLQGKYKDAYVKVFGLLEDSGWKLKKEGEDDDEGTFC